MYESPGRYSRIYLSLILIWDGEFVGSQSGGMGCFIVPCVGGGRAEYRDRYHGITAVSYTHLDVYKRQELTIPYVTKLSGREWPLFHTEDEVIRFALQDLQQADSLLAVDDLYSSSVENSWLNSRRSHFNRCAVYATMARIYHWNCLLYTSRLFVARRWRIWRR